MSWTVGITMFCALGVVLAVLLKIRKKQNGRLD